MLSNRMIPPAVVIPLLAYRDAAGAAQWLCDAFGFTIRLRIGSHRVQLNVGDGALIVREFRPGEGEQTLGLGTSLMIRVEDVDEHRRRAGEHGVRVTVEPATYPYGERQYTAEDFAGRIWTFSQTVSDVPPETWSAIADEEKGR